MVDASAPDPRHDASRDRSDTTPDATSDAWSAWLPDLGPSARPVPAPPPTDPRPPDPAVPPPPQPTTASTTPLPHQPPLPHLPPPPARPTASSSITVSQPGGRSRRLGWTSGSTWNARPLAVGQPPTYLGLAVLALLFWAVPFGIVALVRSVQVSSHWAAGREREAWAASRSARRWSVAAFVAIPCLMLLGLALSLSAAVLVR